MTPAERRRRRELLKRAHEALANLPLDRLYLLERLLAQALDEDEIDPELYLRVDRLLKPGSARRA